MPLQYRQETPGLWVIRVTGLLQKKELETVQAELVKTLGSVASVKLLFILDNFNGWRQGEDWGDLGFFLAHGNKVAQIAIVGDPRWEGGALVFAGAGFRRAPVKYFPTEQEDQARAWIA